MRRLLIGAIALACLTSAGPLRAFDGTTVTFDDGAGDWTPGPDCNEVRRDDGNPGAYWWFENTYCDNNIVLRGWFDFWNASDPAFLGDYGAKGPVRLSVDLDVEVYDYYPFFGARPIPVEESRQLVLELIDLDDPYVDPVTGYSWPWTSVLYPMGPLPDRHAGWKRFSVRIDDPHATELPAGWTGFGGPEDPVTYFPQLPPDRTFADVLAGIDEIHFHTLEPGFFYGFSFHHRIRIDNISIEPLSDGCGEATVYVDAEGIVRGGPDDGAPYSGELRGTAGDDVIVGTSGDDTIQGFGGNDTVCGGAGRDSIQGGAGYDVLFGEAGDDTLGGQTQDDYIDGGDGRDAINGGPGSDTCVDGEIVTACGEERGGAPRRESETTAPARGGTTFVQPR
jgi:hypothetical protein